MIVVGDCREVLATFEACSVDAIVTDPPYHLTSIVKRFGSPTAAPAKSNGATGVYARSSAGFMGQQWDGGDIAFQTEVWEQCLRVLKPGGHLLAFGGSRTYHRLACAIEDSGFEIRDQIMWVYGSGFPKSLDVSKAIDKAAGAEREVVAIRPQSGAKFKLTQETIDNGGFNDPDRREFEITAPATDAAKQWSGWGTALKPAHEPIVVARKPLDGTVVDTVLRHGTGALNIEACRIAANGGYEKAWNRPVSSNIGADGKGNHISDGSQHQIDISANKPSGRWPANLIHDGSDEVLELFPETNGGDSGSVARFFYCAKASRADREEGLDGFEPKRDADRVSDHLPGGDNARNRTNTYRLNNHPTVKPTELMRHLCRLVTPPEGLILDPFAGSGSTGKAAALEGFRFVGIELSPEYSDIARARIAAVTR